MQPARVDELAREIRRIDLERPERSVSDHHVTRGQNVVEYLEGLPIAYVDNRLLPASVEHADPTTYRRVISPPFHARWLRGESAFVYRLPYYSTPSLGISLAGFVEDEECKILAYASSISVYCGDYLFAHAVVESSEMLAEIMEAVANSLVPTGLISSQAWTVRVTIAGFEGAVLPSSRSLPQLTCYEWLAPRALRDTLFRSEQLVHFPSMDEFFEIQNGRLKVAE